MDDHSFSFPSHKNEKIPELIWVNRPKNNFQVPNVDIKPVLTINSTKVLTNLRKIQSNLIKTDQNIHFYSAYKKASQKEKENVSLNRIIHADSLIGMANLIKGGFREKIQMIYFDPRYHLD